MPAGKITALRAQVKDPQRVNVFIDGEFALGVSLNTTSKAGLYVGKQLTAEEFTWLEQIESGDKAYLAALRFLEARPRSVAEVRIRLGRKDFAPEAIDAAIARLGELELLDDAAFARFWVENRQANRPRGAGALRDELRRKGIDADTATQILSDESLTGDESASAWQLARAALHKYAGSRDRNAFTRRMGGFLQRRGFSFEVIRPIVDQLWAEIAQADDQEEGE
ncbi:MAG TPA: RecX family transcriptional regulator [Roseiflexaceae bacterium]|nr:RecX family transcriptional regulator [Roseiflexaceae bacterium]